MYEFVYELTKEWGKLYAKGNARGGGQRERRDWQYRTMILQMVRSPSVLKSSHGRALSQKLKSRERTTPNIAFTLLIVAALRGSLRS